MNGFKIIVLGAIVTLSLGHAAMEEDSSAATCDGEKTPTRHVESSAGDSAPQTESKKYYPDMVQYFLKSDS
ncbi:MAG: hypothetical protein A2621_03375 [Alphaproteobacteria bacterium RIFCSPHIGHO2_01_FULL_41_14]|nr:MAG: hypothetical protein A3K20_01490 [Alphaproteobacteria bacterium GWA1_45_9]OFW89901.1 MAG: hypothetical protein A2621_03375 [Alphaproteobacteria bacterium RIFCSPHIGHO2_01_FULL_41_14]HCI48848.1 hypothetical protein [Holosporales bacterium]